MESNRATYCLLQSVSCATQRLDAKISRYDSGDLFAVGTLLVASNIAPVFDFNRKVVSNIPHPYVLRLAGVGVPPFLDFVSTAFAATPPRILSWLRFCHHHRASADGERLLRPSRGRWRSAASYLTLSGCASHHFLPCCIAFGCLLFFFEINTVLWRSRLWGARPKFARCGLRTCGAPPGRLLRGASA